jgi:stearoyl-CoA desaturase (delta-9 desaturase)
MARGDVTIHALPMNTSPTPPKQIEWVTASFLVGTLIAAITLVPAFIWAYASAPIGWGFIWALFAFYYAATGFGITLGYHRLFSHVTFKATWPVRLATLLFGAAAFEHSALDWSSDHRVHHQQVDRDADPYNISKGFFHAHIGWLLFQPPARRIPQHVKDLQADPLVMWQSRYIHWIGTTVGFVLPTLLGYLYGLFVTHTPELTALACFLIAGILRVVAVQHGTFCINSLCHMVGRQPYSTKHSARDSAWIALITFGEGYHNYHHEFPYDYRNGVRSYQFDPTKWIIWTLAKVGLASNLRRVSNARILLSEITESRETLLQRIQSLSTQLDERSRAIKAGAIESAHALAARISARAELLREQSDAHITLSWQTYRETRRLLRQSALRIGSLAD